MSTALESLKARDQASLCATYGRYPLAVAQASGSRLWDLDGREYVDLLAGIAVTNLGHSHPEVVQAIKDQSERLIHVSNLFFQQEQVVLAERLLSTCTADRVFFCNSGAEANEAACKLARRYMHEVRGRDAHEIITLTGSFHGRTLAMIAATGQDKVKQGFAPMPEGFVTVPWNELTAVEAAITAKTAGVLVEVVQGEGGVRPISPDYAQDLQRLCRERGVLLMIDEVQTGLCRTGRFWAHQHLGLEPDIFTTAKGLANGLPMGAMLATAEVADGFTPGAHATTFGGGALVAAAASKVLEVMERDRLDIRAAEIGAYAMNLFCDVAKDTGKIREVRGLGFMIGIELDMPGNEVWKALLDKGFVCNLTQERVLRLLPALTIQRADLEAFAQSLEDVLRAV